MSETPALPPEPLPSKARVIVNSFVDYALDLLLPTAIFALLAPTGLSAVVRLTIGGFFVAAKACAGRISAPGEPGVHARFGRLFIIGSLIAAACTVVTVATTMAGGSDTLAIGSGTAVLVLVQAFILVRTRRRLDGFALLVVVELAATIVLTSISNDARFVLIRPSFYTAIAGVYVLTTVWTTRPLMMQVSKPMAAGGDPVRAEAFERAGRESLRFRRAEQAMTAGLAILLLAEAVLRVVTVLSLSTNDVLDSWLWSHIPGVALFVAYLAVVKIVFVPRVSREVDALMPAQCSKSDGPI